MVHLRLVLLSGGCSGHLVAVTAAGGAPCTQLCIYRWLKKRMGRLLLETTHNLRNHPLFRLPAVQLVHPLRLSGNL